MSAGTGAVILTGLPGYGMVEGNRVRVEKGPPGDLSGLFPVCVIADDGVAQMGEMDPYLMGSPRFRVRLHIGEVLHRPEHLVTRRRFPSPLLYHGHLFTLHRVPADPSLYEPLRDPRNALDYGPVSLTDRAVFEEGRELLLGPRILGDKNDARCPLIQPVDDARPRP